jgi:rSAM/selenodomain-associated transferase 2
MISIITPVLNEENNIAPFFSNLNQVDGYFELIIVDGGSSDNTLKVIEKHKIIFKKKLKIVKESPGRGYQMNRGAEVSNGNILLFLHVDSTIEKDTIIAIEKEINKSGIVGGCLTQTFSNSDNFLKLASMFGNIRARITKIFFGDCGIFVRKDVFKDLGGYDEIIFLEDVELSKKLKKIGKTILLNKNITTSPRRYLSQGKIKLTIFFTLAYILNSFGKRPEFLNKFIVDK